MQILGALYFGFAMLNRTAKANLIGGIYSRPVAIGNATHFLIGALALIKLAFNDTTLINIWIAGVIYSIFAILFGYVLFTNPVLKNKTIEGLKNSYFKLATGKIKPRQHFKSGAEQKHSGYLPVYLLKLLKLYHSILFKSYITNIKM